MSKLFLDPQKPLHTCKEKNCDDCNVCDDISCHFTFRQLLHFYLIALPPFIIGGFGMYIYNWKFLIIWIGIVILYFGFIEIKVMCSHCPHYAEPKLKSLKCWANYGSYKFWKYKPGPMSKMEKIVFLTGMATVFIFPLFFLFSTKEIFLLLLYLLTLGSFFTTLKNFLCTQCMNFACPLNAVPEETRNKFFKKNPIVAEAWGKNKN